MFGVVLEDLNRSIAADRGVRLEAVRWETGASPGFHAEGAQGRLWWWSAHLSAALAGAPLRFRRIVQHADVVQIAILLCVIEAIADDEFIRNSEAYIVAVNI